MPKPIKIDSEAVAAETSVKAERRLRAWDDEARSGGKSMAKEPDNPVLTMLREIRGRLDRHEERFDKIDKKLDAMSESLTFALGISVQANFRHESVQKKLDALEQRVKRLEERV